MKKKYFAQEPILKSMDKNVTGMIFKFNSCSMAVTHCDSVTMGGGTDDDNNSTRVFSMVPRERTGEKDRK